ncbi:hypothetical protein SIFV0053 [Sulfolobus islandicus filamentous virus]|uniref:Uncharacterized protein 53 n=1 Tax=Sulfolobus islandicus filamentous virus (isolate Iceland/Hveragerdi) TaxID=654908 RepID=Y053_SIFVH|nr:hypothetical protein SIFV0053 [Sulfolobus islandicus filamentous virus]Q914H9.1 RecName: Full=Uncharacterized protein 53 [Sulfolobus islandicus filamentous virus (isolate Hveragerdi)]AAL27762.1 hypothetical protein [Sulfolobus islandicus filamentous virus]
MKLKLVEISSIIRGGANIYVNNKLVATTHNNVTPSFILSLIKSIIGVSAIYGGYFEMPSTATAKLFYKNTPVTSAVLSHTSFTEETISGYEHTRIIFTFSDASRTKYSFDSLQLWTASTHALLSHVSDIALTSPLKKNPQDVVQIDWWIEMESGQPFANILSYLQQQQATYCTSSCTIPSVVPNMVYGYSVFNAFFILLALPNVIQVARDIKTPLTNYLVEGLTLASQVKPQGITSVICYDVCNCQMTTNPQQGTVSEFIGDNYVYVAFNFNNPCPSSEYVVPISTLDLGNGYELQFAVAGVPSNGTGASALLIKIPYGKATLKNLFTHQGE